MPISSPQPEEFVTRTDTVPELWQFIAGLRADDLVAELIQNELDAGSTETVISFEASRMTCTGNGTPVDGDGWVRLSYLKGAGHRAPRKRNLIGIKNHGLKACFAIGSDIAVRSDGKCARQTLHADGAGLPPRPGASPFPVVDAAAPTGPGTVIEVPYRTSALPVSTGEEMVLAACTPETIEALFMDAARTIPARFLGVVRPGTKASYRIELRHHSIGAVRFTFKAGRETAAKGFSTFLRTCAVNASDLRLSTRSLRERVVLRACARPGKDPRDVAEFYRSGKRLLVEVSWSEDGRGRVRPERGAHRYPIAYAAQGPESVTGVGAHYSAPFISDVERHGLAPAGQAWNQTLIRECDSLLVDALKVLVIPRVKAAAMELLMSSHGVYEARLATMAALCLARHAIPLRGGTKRRGKKTAARAAWSVCLAPGFSSNPAKLAEELALVAPEGLASLAPGIRPEVVAALLGVSHPGGPRCLRFDETHVLARLAPYYTAQPFGWSTDEARIEALSDPATAARYLDVLARAASTGPGKRPVLAPGRTQLPDSRGVPSFLGTMKIGAALPNGIPELRMPPLLHPDLAGHPIFRRKEWILPTFGLQELLQALALAPLDSRAANAIFEWLSANPKTVPSKVWPALRALPIWPLGGSGECGILDAYCIPRNGSLASILSPVLLSPGVKVLSLADALRKRHLKVPLRLLPKSSELETWIAHGIGALPTGTELTARQRASYDAFKADLARLLVEPKLAFLFGGLGAAIPALSVSGTLCPRATLVDRVAHATLGLLPLHLAETESPEIRAVLPVCTSPGAEAVRAALRALPSESAFLLPRLSALATRLGKETELGVSDIACIPWSGGLARPDALAFKGNHGNYWGDFRQELSGAALAQADQVLLRHAGVLAARPNSNTSRQFFEWLAAEPARFARHLPQVIRHFAHEAGVASWWMAFPELPCLPACGHRGLVALNHGRATRPASHCYLNDFPELGDELLKVDTDGVIAVDRVDAVARSIREHLGAAGVKSLRHTVGNPRNVCGTDAREAPPGIMAVLDKARSDAMGRQLHNRIVEQGISSALLSDSWPRKLRDIKQIRQASKVTATYSLARRQYQVSVRQAFDEKNGVLWLADTGEEDALRDAFFEALAGRVFVRSAPAFCAPTLEKALKLEFRLSHASFAQTASPEKDGCEGDEEEPGEAPGAHYDWRPDPGKNIPSPGPLASGGSRGKQPVINRRNRTSLRSKVNLEVDQIEQLKRDHYAWHCQMGLARIAPSILAPDGSYVEDQENRKRLIDAHHPDAVAAGGARHAGNILILSHLAHHRFGRHISRAQITDALRAGGSVRTLKFGSGSVVQAVSGVVVGVRLPVSGENVPIFFTDWHRRFWLETS